MSQAYKLYQNEDGCHIRVWHDGELVYETNCKSGNMRVADVLMRMKRDGAFLRGPEWGKGGKMTNRFGISLPSSYRVCGPVDIFLTPI